MPADWLVLIGVGLLCLTVGISAGATLEMPDYPKPILDALATQTALHDDASFKTSEAERLELLAIQARASATEAQRRNSEGIASFAETIRQTYKVGPGA